jgi:hypothetical protein
MASSPILICTEALVAMNAVGRLEFFVDIDRCKLLPDLRFESAGNCRVNSSYVIKCLRNNLADHIIWCDWLVLIHQNCTQNMDVSHICHN